MDTSPDLNSIAARQQTVKGIFILIFATLFFAAQDAISKELVKTMTVFEIVCVRFFFFSLFALTFAGRRVGIRNALRSSTPFMQITRGLFIAGEIAIFAYALQFMGLAEMHALFACFPLLITALSVPLLGEQVGWRRWIAVCTGFIGTLIIIQPGSGVFEPAAAIPLLCALMFAIYNILTRKVSRADSFETSLVYFGLVGFVAFLITMPFFWTIPTKHEAFWLLAISITSIVGHISLIKSLELVPAVILQPFNYFVLIWAMLIGYVFFGEVLGSTTILGAMIVVGSGVYIAWREYQSNKQKGIKI